MLIFGIGLALLLDPYFIHFWKLRLFQIYRFFLNQHGNLKPIRYNLQGKILRTSSMFFIWFVTTYIFCGFGTQLVIQDRSKLINSLEDALEHINTFLWFNEDQFLNVFQQSTSAVEQRIYQRTIESGLENCIVPKDDPAGFTGRIFTEKAALISTDFKIKLIEQILCFQMTITKNEEMRDKGIIWLSEFKFYSIVTGIAFKLGLELEKKVFLQKW